MADAERRAPELLLLARVRRGLRSLNNAIIRGAEGAGLTLQQQAFLLAMQAYGGRDVPFADVRESSRWIARPSVLLQRLVALKLVSRAKDVDQRATRLSLTARGRRYSGARSSGGAEIQAAEHRDELGALREDLERYLGYYLPPAAGPRASRQMPRR